MSVICIEGGDACGKATQSKILAERLNAKLFSFPDYSTTAGQAILENLKGGWIAAHLIERIVERCPDGSTFSKTKLEGNDAVNALVLQSLMLTNRLERSADIIAARRAGHVVLDRYIPSTIVYGTYDGLDPTWLANANGQLPVQPDVYILLDSSVEEGMRRRPERRDRYELDRTRLEHARIEYLKMFVEKHEEMMKVMDAHWNNPAFQNGWTVQRWHIVDGAGTIPEVAERVWDTCVGAGV